MTTTAYAVSLIGADFNAVFTPPTGSGVETTDQPPFSLGQIAIGSGGTEWIYVQAAAAITGQGYICRINEDFQASMLDSDDNEPYGDPCGVPAIAAANDDYLWLQRKGPCSLRVAASANPNVDLVPTATAGELDDGVTTGIFVKGCVLTTANGGSAGTAAAMLDYPVTDTLYEPET